MSADGAAVRPARRRRRARAAWLAVSVVAITAVVGAGAAAAVGVGGVGSGGDRTPASSALPPATAQVTRQTLVDREKADGTLGYGRETTVAGRLAGTLTWLPETGTVVKRGEALYRVDNTPVLLLYGTLPAYRDLAPGLDGADVAQFERELRALGYTGFTVDSKYTSDTAAAVRRWQKAAGLTQTGVVESGRVVFAAAEVRVSTLKLAVGDQAQGAVLTYAGTSRVVTVKLDVGDQRLAKKDAAVSVVLPDGKAVDGTISRVATVIEQGDGGSAAKTKIEVTVALADPTTVTGFDQATVDVTFSASERPNVLTVPVAALLALAEGGYGLEIVEGLTTRIVRVETGLFSGGRVEITGADVREGMTVGVPA